MKFSLVPKYLDKNLAQIDQ